MGRVFFIYIFVCGGSGGIRARLGIRVDVSVGRLRSRHASVRVCVCVRERAIGVTTVVFTVLSRDT